MKTYTAEEARPRILNGSLKGKYAVTRSLDLSGCDLTGVTLPVEVTGWLALCRCDLTGVTLPVKVGGSVELNGCDLTGVTLPVEIGGSFYLSHCKNPDPSQWWREQGQSVKRHCLAISYYVLIETEDGFYYAGCRGPWNAEQALAHWGLRGDERAKLFVEAIKANEKGKLK